MNQTERNINYSTKGPKSFDYKTGISRRLENDEVEKEKVKIVVPLTFKI